MVLERVKLSKCLKILEKCTRDKCLDPQVILKAVKDLFNLIDRSADPIIQQEAACVVVNFIFRGSFFSNDDKGMFLDTLLAKQGGKL